MMIPCAMRTHQTGLFGIETSCYPLKLTAHDCLD